MCDSLLPYLSRGQVKNQNAFYRSLGRLFTMNIQPKIWCSCLFCSKDCILPKCFREKDVLWLEMNGRQKAHIFWTGRKVFFVGRLVRRLSSFLIVFSVPFNYKGALKMIPTKSTRQFEPQKQSQIHPTGLLTNNSTLKDTNVLEGR